MNVTIKNLDPQNPASMARAREGLERLTSLPPGMSKHILEFAISAAPVEEEAPVGAPASTPPADPLAIYGAKTRLFLELMTARVEKHGLATLAEVANDMGIPLDAARAHLRNAGRTASAHNVSLPVHPTWQPEHGYNVYRANAE